MEQQKLRLLEANCYKKNIAGLLKATKPYNKDDKEAVLRHKQNVENIAARLYDEGYLTKAEWNTFFINSGVDL